MKTENKIPGTCRSPIARKLHNHPPSEAKAVAIRAWAPQPNPMTREEIRRMVIDQIG
jgi:hypothetical protein